MTLGLYFRTGTSCACSSKCLSAASSASSFYDILVTISFLSLCVMVHWATQLSPCCLALLWESKCLYCLMFTLVNFASICFSPFFCVCVLVFSLEVCNTSSLHVLGWSGCFNTCQAMHAQGEWLPFDSVATSSAKLWSFSISSQSLVIFA